MAALAALIVIGALTRPMAALTVVVAACILFYTVFAVLKFVVTLAGQKHQWLPRRMVEADDPGLPRYGVLLPVHKEANMLPYLVARVERLEYPREKLRILLLIESDDEETLQAAERLGLPFRRGGETDGGGLGHLTVVVIPPGGPKTKPNAMNVAFDLLATAQCQFCTIYDAEDRPASDQLLRALGTFRAAGPDLACLQAELAFWNDDTNWVTALYWISYKIHFRRFLPGLARLGMTIPLGGTSNHFRMAALTAVALPNGDIWDAHNLTEDADLGARLVAGGYRIDLLHSVTLEEAPAHLRIVDKQQRRWKGGYLQTGLVHTRRPLSSARRMGPVRWVCFNLLMIGTPLSFLLNPLFWGMTVVYFVTRSPVVWQLFPPSVYYPSLALLLIGNFGLLCELVLTCVQEAEHTRGRYGLIKYMFLAPVMWLWISRSTYIAVWEMAIGKRAWHKTPHGHEIGDDTADLVPPSVEAAAACAGSGR
ncbi:glycosyltransferase family 2 protein [Catenulispora rubra]|uniref:glycosyltransferase family 2 protein n=1 Tax=Catenulispora rubra TaxID=280293 RepID=UPI0018924370|nr:glycosyltransferase family 2 protein [Catenulispora rubra]